MSTFNLSSGFQSAVKAAAEDGAKGLIGRLQAALDGLLPDYAGRSLEEVKQAISAAWSGANEGASITDPALTQYAKYIQAGRRIEIRYGGIKA